MWTARRIVPQEHLRRFCVGQTWVTRPDPPRSSWWLCAPDQFYATALAQLQRFKRPLPRVEDFFIVTTARSAIYRDPSIFQHAHVENRDD